MAGTSIHIEVKGADKLIKKVEQGGQRLLKKPLTKGMRAGAKVVRANVVTTARPVGKSLTRGIKTTIDKGSAPLYVPNFAKVKNSAPWINVAEVGRHPGARMPPPGVLKGGYAAAKAVSVRGRPGHHVMARAETASRPGVQSAFDAAAREIEALWRG
jgi:hypothetical protein